MHNRRNFLQLICAAGMAAPIIAGVAAAPAAPAFDSGDLRLSDMREAWQFSIDNGRYVQWNIVFGSSWRDAQGYWVEAFIDSEDQRRLDSARESARCALNKKMKSLGKTRADLRPLTQQPHHLRPAWVDA